MALSSEMKELACLKLLHIAECIDSGRTLNMFNDLTTVSSMLVQLSRVTNVELEEALDCLESAASLSYPL